MQRLTLSEYQTASSVQLTARQRDALKVVASSISLSPSVGWDDRYDLTPSAWIGAIRVPDLEVVVRPKLPIDRVIFLVTYALNIVRWQDEVVHVDTRDTLTEALIPTFVRHLRAAFARGVFQDYLRVDEAATTVRGRIRVTEQIKRRYGIPIPVEIEYDDYTEDVLPNRLLKAAIDRVFHLPVRDARRRWPLRSFADELANVELVRYPRRRVPEVLYTRRLRRYRSALELARLILAGSMIELVEGQVAASAFLVDMNRVFEEFVVEALRDALGVGPAVLVQGARGRAIWLDDAKRIRLEPDLSWWEGGACVFVGDVKYKRLQIEGFLHPDVYQMLAYLTATGIRRGLLIYASGEADATLHRVTEAGKEIEVATLDLSGDIRSLQRQIGLLARRLTQLRNEAVAA